MTDQRFPLYVVSKGRWETQHTMLVLESMGATYHVVVEEQEHDAYAAVLGPGARLLVLPTSYKETFDTCVVEPGPTGSGPARNFAWDHSIENGHPWHWVMDDNITDFFRLHRNLRLRVKTPLFFRMMEDFVLRYRNVSMAGPHYRMFKPRKQSFAPITLNSRVYSCNLIRNDVPFRWRGRYNEDTILSLDMLKAGWCTVLFAAFLADKLTTGIVKGGNTTEIYGNGTMPKSQLLVNLHPDVAELKWKYGRWHHHVDYSGFARTNRLIRRPDVELPAGVVDYGLTIRAGTPDRTAMFRELSGVTPDEPV